MQYSIFALHPLQIPHIYALGPYTNSTGLCSCLVLDSTGLQYSAGVQMIRLNYSTSWNVCGVYHHLDVIIDEMRWYNNDALALYLENSHVTVSYCGHHTAHMLALGGFYSNSLCWRSQIHSRIIKVQPANPKPSMAFWWCTAPFNPYVYSIVSRSFYPLYILINAPLFALWYNFYLFLSYWHYHSLLD